MDLPGVHIPPSIRCRRPFLARPAGARAARRASSRSPPSSTRPTAPTPPTSTTARPLFDGWVDAINAVDASGANCHMSSVGICALLTRMGYAPIMQISCRDRNRIAIQGDVLGAAAMGVANMLCLTGDGVQAGDQPGAKPVFDLDCISLLETIRIMRDNGKFLSGRKLTTPPQLFLGAADQPLRAALRFPRRPPGQEDRRRRAVRADPVLLRRADVRAFMERVRDLGLDRARASSWPASARWPRPRPRAGSAPTCPASTSPTRSSSGSRAPRTRRRKASSSAST